MTGSATTAVIVAAGAGSRLGGIGRLHSKAMVPLLDQPLIGWVIERVLHAGVGRLVVVAHRDDDALRAYLELHPAEIAITFQDARRGMADAVARALPLLDDEPYLACACDSLFLPEDIGRVVALGRQHRDSAVIGVLEMGVAATASRSAVVRAGDQVVAIHEKPAPGTARSGLVGMPLYWLPRRLDPYLQQAPASGPERQVADALGDYLAAGGDVFASEVLERLEITRPEDIATVAGILGADRFG